MDFPPMFPVTEKSKDQIELDTLCGYGTKRFANSNFQIKLWNVETASYKMAQKLDLLNQQVLNCQIFKEEIPMNPRDPGSPYENGNGT